jgi:hypothetical protein
VDTLRITTCDSDDTLSAASGLFNQYRHHYGEPPDEDERTFGWLTDMVRSNMLIAAGLAAGRTSWPRSS